MYENFVGTWETVRNREVSVLERCPHGEVRLYLEGWEESKKCSEREDDKLSEKHYITSTKASGFSENMGF